jgi:hypothetical protein
MAKRLWKRYVLMAEYLRQQHNYFNKDIELMQQRAEADEAPYDAVARDIETGEWRIGRRGEDGRVYIPE